MGEVLHVEDQFGQTVIGNWVVMKNPGTIVRAYHVHPAGVLYAVIDKKCRRCHETPPGAVLWLAASRRLNGVNS